MSKVSSTQEFKVFLIGTFIILILGLYLMWSGTSSSCIENSCLSIETASLTEVSTTDETLQKHIKIWEKPWFMNVMKLIFTALVLQIYFLAIARPALRVIIYGSSEGDAL